MKIFWNERLGIDCGVDEAGRGPWAGPVVAAAVILPKNFLSFELNDSKIISNVIREKLFKTIVREAQFGLGFGSVAEIDKYNVLQATFLAMRRAVAKLNVVPDKILIDGNMVPSEMSHIAESITRGDTKVASIAAASIIAKVTRDKFMKDLALRYPGYGWEKNFGYGVKEHREALKSLGVTPEHRRSFRPIHNMLC